MADSWHRDWDDLPSWGAAAVAQAAGCSDAFVHNLLAQAVTLGLYMCQQDAFSLSSLHR